MSRLDRLLDWLAELPWRVLRREPPRAPHPPVDLDTAAVLAAIATVRAQLADVHAHTIHMHPRFTQLEEIIVTTSQEIVARLDAATTEIADDLTALRDRLTAAVADKDAAVQAAVTEALAGFDAPIARLEALGQDPADPVPAPAEPAEPDAPAEDPAQT